MSDMLSEGLAAFDRQFGDEPGTDETTATADTETTAEVATPVEAHDETAEQPRDEAGRFAAKETADVADDAAAEAAEQVKQDLILGRFKSHEELEKAYASLEGEYGRRSREWGEVKKELEQIREQTAPQQTRYEPDSVQDYFAENPAQILPAIQQAYASGDRTIVYLGIKALDDVDPVLAEGLRSEIAKRDAVAELGPQLERNAQNDFNTTFAAAWHQVKADYPDLDQFADQILQAAEQDPETLRGLTEGTPESAKRTIATLYKIAAFDASKQDGALVAKTAAEEETRRQQEAETAKREGFVATGTQRVGSEKQEQLDPILAAFDKAAERYTAD